MHQMTAKKHLQSLPDLYGKQNAFTFAKQAQQHTNNIMQSTDGVANGLCDQVMTLIMLVLDLSNLTAFGFKVTYSDVIC